jgi:hypothetical protein
VPQPFVVLGFRQFAFRWSEERHERRTLAVVLPDAEILPERVAQSQQGLGVRRRGDDRVQRVAGGDGLLPEETRERLAVALAEWVRAQSGYCPESTRSRNVA